MPSALRRSLSWAELYALLDARNERINEENERMKQDAPETNTGGYSGGSRGGKRTSMLFRDMFPQAALERSVKYVKGGADS